MITIHTVMLVVLGFLLASLLALMLAPAYRARTVRLTTKRLKRSIPLTEEEIRADKDRVKTQYALRVHELERAVEKATLSAARQRIELNRRDAVINGLEGEVSRLQSELEQHLNARRVLEQTVTDRVPAIEQRLAETRALLHQRDRELAAITGDTSKTVRALDEAMRANAQQRAEIDRLSGLLGARRRGRDNGVQGKADGLAGAEPHAGAGADAIASPRADTPTAEAGAAQAGALANGAAAALLPAPADATRMSEQMRGLEATIEEQAGKIRRLEAAVAAYEQGEGSAFSLKGSKLAMKARIAALQADVESQAASIQKLKAELAQANERLALQSAQFMDEMRRFGAGTMPATGPARRPAAGSSRRSLLERIVEPASPPRTGAAGDAAGPASQPRAGEEETTSVSIVRTAPGADAAARPAAPASGEAAREPDTAAQEKPAEKASGAKRKASLMERIAGLSES